ncbi:MAG: hypothetical protein ACXWYG_07255 [Aeromicrobium sp.]
MTSTSPAWGGWSPSTSCSARLRCRSTPGPHRDHGSQRRQKTRLLIGSEEPDTGSAALGASVAVGVIDQARTT